MLVFSYYNSVVINLFIFCFIFITFLDENMNYEDLYKILVQPDNITIHFPTNERPVGFVLYNLGYCQRASNNSLRLTPCHKCQWAQPREFKDKVVVKQAYPSINFKSVLYCAWLESEPNIIVLWVKDTDECITSVIEGERFSMASSTLLSSVNLTLEKTVFHSQLTTLSEADMVYVHDIVADVNYITLQDDETFDPTGTIGKYRELQEFKEMESILDAIYNIRMNCTWCNLQKTLSAELKCLMKVAINAGSKVEPQIALPIEEWLPAMWLQTIGCPKQVRNSDELRFMVCRAVLNVHDRTVKNIANKLLEFGFRDLFSRWISFRLCSNIEQFGRDLQSIAKPISWNSFLLVEEELDQGVKFTHLKKVNNEYVNVKPYTPLVMKVVEFETIYPMKVCPLLFNCETGANWYPIQFAEKVFFYIQQKLSIPDTYLYGHCTSEQGIIRMSQVGLSPFATFQNEMSCGHGMYFFRFDQTILNYDFHFLNAGVPNNVNDEIVIKQFRSFVYAMTRCFDVADFDSLCPAVLLILVPTGVIQEFDAVNELLPLEDGQMEALTLNSVGEVERTDSILNPFVSIGDIRCAINMVPTEPSKYRVEKINGLALLSGIVDFSLIPSGVYCANVMDNSFRSKALPFSAIKKWQNNDPQEIDKWKKLVSGPISDYWRPNIAFVNQEQVSNNCKLHKMNETNNMKQKSFIKIGDTNVNVDVSEHVFVTTYALHRLLQCALSCEVAFVGLSNQVEKNDGIDIFTEDTTLSTMILTEKYVKNTVKQRKGGTPIHDYWILHI